MTLSTSSRRAAEKREQLDRISNERGQFTMLAVDQRGSLRGMIEELHGDVDIAPSDLTLIKRIVTETTAPASSAVLLDPIYGFPEALGNAEFDGGVLVSAEKTGYRLAHGNERLTRLVDSWDPVQWADKGVNAIKLLLWHHPGVSEATRRHQHAIVQQVGDQCAEAGLLLLLEAKVYALNDELSVTEWAARKPELVIDAATTYSASRFQVDVLKLDFPGDLKFTEEFQRPDVSWKSGRVAYGLQEVKKFARRLDRASRMPWVILSAGVDLEEFIACIELANEAGASGFLCGRTVWKDMVKAFPNEPDMRRHMEDEGRRRFELIKQANKHALPWQEHKLFETSSLAE